MPITTTPLPPASGSGLSGTSSPWPWLLWLDLDTTGTDFKSWKSISSMSIVTSDPRNSSSKMNIFSNLLSSKSGFIGKPISWKLLERSTDRAMIMLLQTSRIPNFFSRTSLTDMLTPPANHLWRNSPREFDRDSKTDWLWNIDWLFKHA